MAMKAQKKEPKTLIKNEDGQIVCANCEAPPTNNSDVKCMRCDSQANFVGKGSASIDIKYFIDGSGYDYYFEPDELMCSLDIECSICGFKIADDEHELQNILDELI